MATISFDIGGVISADPKKFQDLMLGFRKFGHRIIVVTAIGHGDIIPPGEPARQAFSHGRLYQLGVNLAVHYDACYTTGDHGKKPATGALKAVYLEKEKAAVHIDDQMPVLNGIKKKLPDIKIVHYKGQPFDHLRDQITASLPG